MVVILDLFALTSTKPGILIHEGTTITPFTVGGGLF